MLAPTAGRYATRVGDQGPRRRRPVLLAFVVIVGAVALIGAATAVYLYDRATAIDRSTPAVVAEQLLQAALAEEDAARVGLFICNDWSSADAMAQLRSNIDPEVQVGWAPVRTVLTSESTADVTVRVTLQYPGEIAPSGGEVWRLSARNDQGWRVCSVEKDA